MIEHITTTDHYGIVNAGGLLLINQDDIEDLLEEREDISPSDLVSRQQTLTISPQEALQIAALVERHRSYLEERAAAIDVYFAEVAQAWLDEFQTQAVSLVERGEYWWPEIRHQAQNLLLDLTVTRGRERTNPIVTGWYEQIYTCEDFPRQQQEELLTRHFKRLYYAKYPVPEDEDAALEDENSEQE